MLEKTVNSETIDYLIVDDDEGMRLLLTKIIGKDKRFNKQAEAKDGKEGFEAFLEKRPQLVFLDVDMPGENGIECAKKIFDVEPKTILVFVTAHEQYMPDAFEVYAFDYIVKPFKPERIIKTMERICDLRVLENTQPVLSMETETRKDKLIIKCKEGISFINMADIILIQREERTTVIYTVNGGKYATTEGLGEIQERLDESFLIRCHKSYIINLTKIANIYNYGRWTYLVKFIGTPKDALMNYEKYNEIEKLYGLK